MIAPILPGIVSSQAVGNILSAQYLAVVFGQIAIGALADCFGRRQVIVFVMLFDAITFTATGFTKDVTSLIILRLLAGCAAPVALGISYVAAASQGLPPDKARFNFALVGAAFNFGTLAGAATGGLLGPELWLPANVASGAVPMLVALWALLTEDIQEGRREPPEATPATLAPLATPAAPAETVVSMAVPAAFAPDDANPNKTKAVVSIIQDGSRPQLRTVLAKPETAAWLMAYAASGLFQGGFFSLMPVLVSTHTSVANATEGDASASAVNASGTPFNATTSLTDDTPDPGSEAIIAAVIVISSFLQLLSNLFLVRKSLKVFGAHGHLWSNNALLMLLLVAIAALVGAERTPSFISLLCTLFCLAYVCSAGCLTVLNQYGTAFARHHGVPVGTMTGIGRSLFAACFGIAPAGSIALLQAATWLPVAAIATVSGMAAVGFLGLCLTGQLDLMPSDRKQRDEDAASSAPNAKLQEEDTARA